MKPAIRPLRAPSRPICQFCDHLLQQPAYRRAFLTTSSLKIPSIRRPLTRQHGAFAATPARGFSAVHKVQEVEPEIERPESSDLSLAARLKRVEDHIDAIHNTPRVQDEAIILLALSELETIARMAIAARAGQPRGAKLNLRQSSAASVLSIAAEDTEEQQAAKAGASKSDGLPSPAYLSELALDLIRDEKVFLSRTVLSKYVDLQRLLGAPRQIPEALYLYANKPIPIAGSKPPQFKKQSPKSYKAAVPKETAEKALDAAIDAKDMVLALTVVDHTYCAPAWKTYKWLTKFAPPAAIASTLPFLAYFIASEWSIYSGYVSPTLFKWYSFAGFMVYFGGTGTLGYVALTTWNDHFERVVWQPGTPLLQRWMREDERGALDKIACAWGFKETWKWGDEEGEDWEGLRQWCFLRKMWLDKPDLMPGMNPPMVD
ncbi:uncharacterized protein EI97DRAFT_419034 [Westerdykella ornata]|uniref:Uncharacterized protein n=1 Tax=Westerdykella ornata TaxID=318751 RepID=A0A6A6JIX4_WESOR|nr:uncharacterized protein EI97DRAFT_419034 [Westerdykella ornata]KAF2276185.1 hypothetical protein EI97DRAFT_419034 [Westerdykella ornata]